MFSSATKSVLPVSAALQLSEFLPVTEMEVKPQPEPLNFSKIPLKTEYSAHLSTAQPSCYGLSAEAKPHLLELAAKYTWISVGPGIH